MVPFPHQLGNDDGTQTADNVEADYDADDMGTDGRYLNFGRVLELQHNANSLNLMKKSYLFEKVY
jgi:hypothetical protein